MIYTREQLIAQGCTDSQVSYGVRRGTYTRVLPNVYATGDLTPLMRCQAIIAWQPQAVLSHQTAGWLHNWLPVPETYEATVHSAKRLATPNWLRLYRRTLEAELVGEDWALPVTTPTQTLLDCLESLPLADSELLIDSQLGKSVQREELRCLVRSTRRHGNRQLRHQLRLAAVDWLSVPERQLAREFRRREFEIGTNVPIGPYWGDFVDERAMVVAEVDGREPHSQRTTFNRDRIRQNWLIDRGWHVRRYAAEIVLCDVSAVADEIISVVRRRRRSRRK